MPGPIFWTPRPQRDPAAEMRRAGKYVSRAGKDAARSIRGLTEALDLARRGWPSRPHEPGPMAKPGPMWVGKKEKRK